MIVCVCQAVSDQRVRQCIEAGASSVEELQIELGVATCCGCCEDSVREILEQSGVCASSCASTRSSPLVFMREAVAA